MRGEAGTAEDPALRRADGRRHLLALDSLRGICACMVALYHFESDALLAHNALIRSSYLFVDFFFVLSGFVIAESYGAKLRDGFATWRFMALRLGRLYPLHAAVLLALLALQLVGLVLGSHLKLGGDHSAPAFLASLFLVQVFTHGDVGGWNAPSWSISAELWTYLVFALLVRFCARRWLVPVMVLAVLAAPWIVAQYSDRNIDVCYEGALGRCIYGFFMGALANRLWHRHGAVLDRMGSTACTAAELALVALSVTIVCVVGVSPWSFAAPWVFAATILIFTREGGAVSALLKTRPLLLVGSWSYSIYMVHEFVQARMMNLLALRHWRLRAEAGGGLVQHVVTRTDPFPFASDLLTLAMLGVTLVAAWACFHLIEEPGRLASRRLFGGRRPAA